MSIERSPFGTTANGDAVERITLTNEHGFRVNCITYGAAIISIETPDRNGDLADVVLGFDDLAGYEQNDPFLGVCCGRMANRIAKGRFELNGKTYDLAINNEPNHLHGGPEGFHTKVWKIAASTDSSVTLRLESPDGDANYPGNLSVELTYSITADNALEINYAATTDQTTLCNLTNHSYFNLTGTPVAHYDHLVQIHADRYTVVDETCIPTGELRPVAGTPMDFSTPATIGSQINQVGTGHDHNYCLTPADSGTPICAARVVEPTSGRTLECWTTAPGVQFYTGYYLEGTTGKNGATYPAHSGFCLETQTYPDSPNHPDFPSPVLNPGETYRHTCIYRFGVEG